MKIQGILKNREEKKVEEENKKNLEQVKLEKSRKIAKERMHKDRQQRDAAKQQKELLEKYVKSPEITFLANKFRRQLLHIFQFFSRQEKLDLNETVSEQVSTINFAKFSKMCLVFHIVPEIMLAEDIVYIYRHATKTKSEALKTDLYKSKNKSFAEKDTQLLDYDV